jgi:hypothetical protein
LPGGDDDDDEGDGDRGDDDEDEDEDEEALDTGSASKVPRNSFERPESRYAAALAQYFRPAF